MTRPITAALAVTLGLLFATVGASMTHGQMRTSVPLAVPAIRPRRHS